MPFALRFDRPDKRAPFISWFASHMDADRTAQSIMHLTAKDYGAKPQFYAASFGYKVNLARLIEASGEERLAAQIRSFADAPKGVIVHMRPRRIISWERATPEAISHWDHGERAPIRSVTE